MNTTPRDGLSEQEAMTLVTILGKLKRPYREEVFQAIVSAFIMCPVELVALTRSGRVLMQRRPASDPHFANLWHTTGTVMLKGDTIESALMRIIERELANVPHESPIPRGYVEVPHGGDASSCPRGQELALVFTCIVDEETYKRSGGEGEFFALDQIPTDTVKHHKAILLPYIRAQCQH